MKKTADIFVLIKVRMDKHGNIRPIKKEDCPLWKAHRISTHCIDGTKICKIGLETPPGKKHNVIKRIKKGPEGWELMQCNYYVNKKRGMENGHGTNK